MPARAQESGRLLATSGVTQIEGVDSSALKYESAEQPPGQAIEVQFPAAGTFEIRCHIHPKMLLTVNVR